MNSKQIYVYGMIVKGLIEAMGMQAENEHSVSCGNGIRYGESAFNKIIEDNGIYHNAILSELEEM